MKPNYVAKKSICSALSFWSIVSCILIIPIFILALRIIAVKKYRIEFYDDKIIITVTFRDEPIVIMTSQEVADVARLGSDINSLAPPK